MLDGVKEQVYDVFERHISPDIKRRDMIITNLESQKEPCLKKSRNRFEKIMRESSKKFAYTYNRFDRPIVGIYHQNGHFV